jgi:fatty acid desaturase
VFDYAGILPEYSLTALQKDFHSIIRKLEEEGRFTTDYWFYINKITLLAVFMCFIWSLVFLPQYDYFKQFSANRPWLVSLCYIISSLSLGMFWQQAAFLGHDFGHNGVSGTAQGDLVGSLAVTMVFGVSAQWWKRNHNVHHVHTNSIDCDPDIQHLPFLAIDAKIFQGYWSTYYHKIFQFDKFSQFFVTKQHHLYYVAMAVARANLYVQSFMTVLNPRLNISHRILETAALCAYWAWFIALLSFLPDNTTRMIYILLSHSMCGLIHVQITLSHFALPGYYGPGYSNDDTDSFLKTQFYATMDVDCPEQLDWLHGGLQFQIEHHLLPRLPRHNLRYAAEKYIRPLAAAHNLPYHNYSFFKCNQLVLRNLRQQAQLAKSIKNNNKESMLWQYLMADG